METDLFEFWAAVPGHARQHPADATVLSRMRHNFRLDCLPNQFFGPLRSARVVFLVDGALVLELDKPTRERVLETMGQLGS